MNRAAWPGNVLRPFRGDPRPAEGDSSAVGSLPGADERKQAGKGPVMLGKQAPKPVMSSFSTPGATSSSNHF